MRSSQSPGGTRQLMWPSELLRWVPWTPATANRKGARTLSTSSTVRPLMRATAPSVAAGSFASIRLSSVEGATASGCSAISNNVPSRSRKRAGLAGQGGVCSDVTTSPYNGHTRLAKNPRGASASPAATPCASRLTALDCQALRNSSRQENVEELTCPVQAEKMPRKPFEHS